MTPRGSPRRLNTATLPLLATSSGDDFNLSVAVEIDSDRLEAEWERIADHVLRPRCDARIAFVLVPHDLLHGELFRCLGTNAHRRN